MTRRTRVYVAGPITLGDVCSNVRRAMVAADKLISEGYAPLVPHLWHFQHLFRPHDYGEWLDVDLTWLRVADVVLRLPGESNGAEAKVAYARDLDLPVFSGETDAAACQELINHTDNRVSLATD